LHLTKSLLQYFLADCKRKFKRPLMFSGDFSQRQ
jgi:hypothetical protein